MCAITTAGDRSGVAHSCGYFPELSRRFADVRELFGILKRGTSLCHWTMSETLSLILGADVSVSFTNQGHLTVRFGEYLFRRPRIA